MPQARNVQFVATEELFDDADQLNGEKCFVGAESICVLQVQLEC